MGHTSLNWNLKPLKMPPEVVMDRWDRTLVSGFYDQCCGTLSGAKAKAPIPAHTTSSTA